jgi:hypothetical protein
MQNAQDTRGFKRRSPINLTPTYLNRYRHYRNFCRCADLIRGGFHIDIYVAFASIYILHLFLNGKCMERFLIPLVIPGPAKFATFKLRNYNGIPLLYQASNIVSIHPILDYLIHFFHAELRISLKSSRTFV